MADNELKLIISAVNEVSKPIARIKDDLGGIDDAAQKAGSGLGGLRERLGAAFGGPVTKGVGEFKTGMADAVEQVTGLSIGSLSMAGAVTAGVTAIVAATREAANYGDEMGDLAQITGATVEQTSLMVSSFELVGVSVDTITAAMKAMTKNGMTPNLETMKQLAAEYQAIQDPVQQNEFLFKNFGKAGLEMAEIMGKSTEELQRLEDAARSSGKVIGEEFAGQAEELNLQMAILTQKVEGAKIQLGSAFVPAASAALDGVTNLAKAISAASIAFQLKTGIIDQNQAALRAEALAAGDLTAHLHEVTAVAEKTTTVTADQREQYRLLRTGYTDVSGASGEFSAAMEYELSAADKLTVGLKNYNEQLLFSLASANMDAEAALNLGVAMGVIDTKALLAAESVNALKDKYDQNRDGAISASEASRGYSAAVEALSAAIASIPEQKKVRIEIESYGGSMALPSAGIGGGQNAVPRAFGGPVIAGTGYAVHPPEMYFSPRETGFIMSQDDTLALLNFARGQGGGLQSVSISVDARGAADPAAVEAAGYRGARRALEESGRYAEARRTTRAYVDY